MGGKAPWDVAMASLGNDALVQGNNSATLYLPYVLNAACRMYALLLVVCAPGCF
jgi:hypothetical protein